MANKYWNLVREWTPPRAYWVDGSVLMLGSLLAVGSWMNGLFWISVPHEVAFLIRSAIAAMVFYLLTYYLRRWPARHSSSLPEATDGVQLQADDNFVRLTPEQKLTVVKQTLTDLGPIDAIALRDLTLHMTAPASVRSRSIERVELTGRSRRHYVELEFSANSFSKIGNRYVLLLSRPEKDKRGKLLNLGAESSNGQRLQMLSFAEAAAITYTLCMELLGSLTTLPSAEAHQFEIDIAELVLSQQGHKKPGVIYSKAMALGLISRSNAPRCRAFLTLMTVASMRRPLFAATSNPDIQKAESVHFLFETIRNEDFSVRPYEWWRSKKDYLRSELRYPARMIYISFERARSCAGYELTVTAPTGLYVDESRAVNRRNGTGRLEWLQPVPREEMRKSYVGWEQVTGRSTVTLGARWFHRTNYTNPYFCIRFMEIPPGTMGSATITSVAVLVTTWLCGALPPSSNSSNVDIVAFIIALPAFLSSFFSLLSRGSTDRLYRSLSALASLVFSAMISLGSLVLYLGRNSERQHIRPTEFWHEKTILFVDDYAWFILLALAIANFLMIGGTLLMRTARYQRQVTGT